MIVAADIFDEVEAGVIALNGEIVRRAFHGTCCNFLANRNEFGLLLARYITCKMEIHRSKIAQRRMSLCNEIARYYEKSVQNKLNAENLRAQLREIWPCAACIWLYNPTHRLRRFPQLVC